MQRAACVVTTVKYPFRSRIDADRAYRPRPHAKRQTACIAEERQLLRCEAAGIEVRERIDVERRAEQDGCRVFLTEQHQARREVGVRIDPLGEGEAGSPLG